MQRLPHPQKGIPAGLHSIREAHENDTADELDQVEHAEGLCVLWQRIAADGRVTQREARAMSAALQEHAEGDLESLNNNRHINGMYCEMAQPVHGRSWPALDLRDFRPEAA